MLVPIFCEKHQKEASVIDLDRSQRMCEKCALFNPLYRSHQFIDAQSLPQHSNTLYQQFRKRVDSLNITVDKEAVSRWWVLEAVAQQTLGMKEKQINLIYDEMIMEIEMERRDKLISLQREVENILSESNQSVNLIAREKYYQIYCKDKYLEQCLKDKKFMEISKQLFDRSHLEIISSIEKDLQIIQIDLKQKLVTLIQPAVPIIQLTKRNTVSKDQLLISRRNTMSKDQLLLPIQEKQRDSIRSSFRLQSLTVREHCKTEMTFVNPETEREMSLVEEGKSKELTISTVSINVNPKNTKQLHKKSEVKECYLKNNIRLVVMTQLGMNNREALQAIRKCTFGTFVSKIDLSYNELSTPLIGLLKKEKMQNKFLKSIVLKGIKLDPRVLKKQGINVDKMSEGVIKLGELMLQF